MAKKYECVSYVRINGEKVEFSSLSPEKKAEITAKLEKYFCDTASHYLSNHPEEAKILLEKQARRKAAEAAAQSKSP